MILASPTISPNGLYSLGQAAKALGVSRSTIYRYESRGLLLFRRRKLDNRRVISGRHLLRICQISLNP